MCEHGTLKTVRLNTPRENSGRIDVPVDYCIADEVQALNNAGVVTLGSCCGHGIEGQYPHVLIKEESAELAMALGYHSSPYLHGRNEYLGVYEMCLKSQ